MRYLVAVSGGIDSCVLLDKLASEGEHELIVAHFDHGIRDDSAADSRFVEALARRYDIPFVSTREELGASASEELARTRRYDFLHQVAREHDAVIATAHHADDIIETIAINYIRGTGWRGMAILSGPTIARPLLHLTKVDIRTYALDERLEWVEDSTNSSTHYLRNRVRRAIASSLPSERIRGLYQIWQRQVILRDEIDELVRLFLQTSGQYERYFFTQIDSRVACELLRAAVFARAGVSPTRPQTERALLSIKTARGNTQYEVGGGAALRFTMRTFIVQTP